MEIASRSFKALSEPESICNPHIHQEVARTLKIAQAQCAHFPWLGICLYRSAGAVDNDAGGVNGFQIRGVGAEIR